ncbi:hypothetical protein TrLO_g12166 [Triparma laevis f. longispina]|uniref:Uncharacterized protein n=1 Tax=Triparma laevis f. longispina TaxID=1714387 RepID=A0A9W7C766_9STRA|nr:hypothetical protein TrLO_g12166 [Triparma laevis f. longispina]
MVHPRPQMTPVPNKINFGVPKPRSKNYRSNLYTAAIIRGQHPTATAEKQSLIWDHVHVSSSRLKHVECGERLYSVVEKEIKIARKDEFKRDAQSALSLKIFSPPFQRSFLPARLSTPSLHIKRPKTKYYYNTTQKVEMHVARLARKLGADHTPHEQEEIDLSPSLFTGVIKTTKGMNKNVFASYFNRDPAQVLLFGSDFGFETVGNSFLEVDRRGRVSTQLVDHFRVDDKVTFRILNFDNMLQYLPLTYGAAVWIVVTSGDGSQNWRNGSLLGAKVTSTVGVKISEHVVGEEREPKQIGENIADTLMKKYGRRRAENINLDEKKDANHNVRTNNNDTTSSVNKGKSNIPFSSKNVGTVKPINAAIPSNRAEYQHMIEKPTQHLQILNRKHVPLGRWILRSATGKKDGDYVCNTDEVYFEQDFYYLSSTELRGGECCVRQLPAEFTAAQKTADGQYNVDRRGVFKIRLADTNPNVSGLSVSDKSVEMLEARAKRSLHSSQHMRGGGKEYAVIDMKSGGPKPLSGGEEFSKGIRLQLKSEVESMDDASLAEINKRDTNMHKFFEEKFDSVGPPDDDIIAKISGASSVFKVPSLDGEGSVVSRLSYGPVLGGGIRPNSVQFHKGESKYKHDVGFLPSVLGNTTLGSDDEDDEEHDYFDEDHNLLTNNFDRLCDSVTVGGTFGKLKKQDELLFTKLADDWENEQEAKRIAEIREASSPSPIKDHRFDSPETVGNGSEIPDDFSIGDLSAQTTQTNGSSRSLSKSRPILKNSATFSPGSNKDLDRNLKKQQLIDQHNEKQASARKLRTTTEEFLTGKKQRSPSKEILPKKIQHGRHRSLLLPQQGRATVLKQLDSTSEVKSFNDLVPGLLENYTQKNMINCMKDLDNLITKRLTATERQRKFEELANFEKMARENLAIEKAVRLARQKEIEEQEAAEQRKKAELLAARAAETAGGRSRKSTLFGGKGSRMERKTRGTRDSRKARGTMNNKEKDAVEVALESRGVGRGRETMGGSYKKKLLREKTGLRVGMKEAMNDAAAEAAAEE